MSVKQKIRTWFGQSIYNQIFGFIFAFSLLLSLTVGVIGWSTLEITADSFINQRLEQAMDRLLVESKTNGELIKLNHGEFKTYQSGEALPNFIAAFSIPGLYEVHGPNIHIEVVENPLGEGLYYLVYQPDKDDIVAKYGSEIDIHIMLTMTLIIVLGFFAAHFLASKISAPIRQLAIDVHQIQPQQAFPPLERQDELGMLSTAFSDTVNRINAFIHREKSFNRYASHELRTPVAVIQGALELLDHTQMAKDHPKPLKRISDANEQMKDLIATFLTLGCEQASSLDIEQRLPAQTLLQESLAAFAQLQISRQITLRHNLGHTTGPELPKALGQVLFNNLIRNAMSYCDKRVKVVLNAHSLVIINDLSAHNSQGYGHGIEIMEQICQRAGWTYLKRNNGKYYISQINFTPCDKFATNTQVD